MALQGMPDFQSLIRDKDVFVFAPFDGQSAYTLWPRGLEIAKHDDGSPDFHLGIVRPEVPNLPPTPYGMLDFRLQASFPTEEGLALVRSAKPGAVIISALFRDGFVQISPVGNLSGAASQLFVPVPINFQGLGVTRFFTHLDLNAALMLKDMLQSSVAALRAAAHVEVWGIAPRLPLQVSFDPSAFLSYLLSKAEPDRRLSRNSLVAAFLTSSGDIPWTVAGKMEQVDPATFAECMADHVRMRFASLAAPKAAGDLPMLKLTAPGEIGTGTFTWDLNEPAATARLISLNFDPLAAARALVTSHGIDAVVSMDTVRRLQTGVVSVAVVANLPAQRQGVLSLGATVNIPPKLPFRPQQINQTVELQEPKDSSSFQVQLSPKEKLSYTYRTFLILQDSGGISRLEGKDTAGEGEKLDLHIDDFPVSFIQLEASDRLLAAGAVSGTLRYDDRQTPFSLTSGQPRLSLAVPNESSATLDFECRSSDGAHLLKLEMPARTFRFDLSSFREYGPQTLDIRCTFHEGTQLFAIDLLPESSAESAGNITVLAMTPQSPQKEWKWFASSPFAPGYRYRIHESGQTPAPWSEVRSPFEPLLLDTAVLSPTVAGGQS